MAGRADVLAALEFRPGKPKMRHPGTFNANPLSAAAGRGGAAARGDRRAVPPGQRRPAASCGTGSTPCSPTRDWPWVAYGDFSMFRLLPNYHGPRPAEAAGDDDGLVPYGGDLNKLDGPPANPKLRHAFRQAMLLNGVDMPGLGGWLTAAHSPEDIDRTVQAVAASIEQLGWRGLWSSVPLWSAAARRRFLSFEPFVLVARPAIFGVRISILMPEPTMKFLFPITVIVLATGCPAAKHSAPAASGTGGPQVTAGKAPDPVPWARVGQPVTIGDTKVTLLAVRLGKFRIRPNVEKGRSEIPMTSPSSLASGLTI